MEKKLKGNQSNNNGRKIDGINLGRDTHIFRPEVNADKGSANKDFSNFYNELDRKRKSKKPFVAFMLIIFTGLFVLMVYGLWNLRGSLSRQGIVSDGKNTDQYLTDQVVKELSDKTSGESVSIPITESELANFMGVGTADFPLKKSSLEIKNDGVYISGRTSDSFFSFPITIVAIPKAENGKLKIELSKASSGVAVLPQSIKDALNKYFDDQISTYTSDIGRIEVKEVVLKPHEIDLLGTAL